LLQLGRTPLLFAIFADNADTVELLLQHGARPGEKKPFTPLRTM
jgi:ankyrin repeat protein